MRVYFFLLSLLWSLPVYAGLNAGVQFTFEMLTDDFDDLLTYAWPVIAVVVSAFVIIKAFKRVIFSI
jgi:hypothetical protein